MNGKLNSDRMNVMQDRDNESVDGSRRTWLIAASVLGGAGGVATAVPFVGSFAPSERARAAGGAVEVDIGELKPGELLTVAWRGMPIWVFHRTDKMLADIRAADNQVADPHTSNPFSMPDPDYCKNEFRSRPEHKHILVTVAVCTHLGCTPIARLQEGPQPNLPDDWPGGFLCPCHGSTYDLAGRVFRNKPAPQNLDIPRFMFTSATQLVIGKDEKGEA